MFKVFINIISLFVLYSSLIYTRPLPKLNRFKKKLTFVIDPGHGGEFKGCPSYSEKYFEKDMTLDIALRLDKLLASKPFRVILTRYNDKNFDSNLEADLQKRVDKATDFKADFLISIHLNSAPDTKVRGFEVFVPEQGKHVSKSRELAEIVKADLLAHAKKDSQFKSYWDRGVKTAPFYILRNSRCPTILIELEFITNPKGEELIRSSIYRQRLANILAQSIIKYAQKVK